MMTTPIYWKLKGILAISSKDPLETLESFNKVFELRFVFINYLWYKFQPNRNCSKSLTV
jgi:hypothetical protein